MKRFKGITLTIAAFGFALLLVSAAQAQFVVTKTADTNDGACDADCSLREAIVAANAAAGANTITFDATAFATGGAAETIILTLGATNTTTAATGDLDITDSLTITGTGARELIINGNDNDRIFDVTSGDTVTITDLTVTNGSVDGDGGGIRSLGTLTLTRVSVNDNQLTGSNNDGGGIFNDGTLTIADSTVSNNRANISNGDGGGIRNDAGATVVVTNSTISDNQATGTNGNGGGIDNGGTSVTLINVTVSNNSSVSDGGGLNGGTGTGSLRNTIVANNTAVGGNDPDVAGAFNSGGGNLIGINAGATASFPAGNPNANGDRVGTAAAPIDPLLGPLADNGGQTDTRALLTGSPAIDAGVSPPPSANDQRGVGFPRQNGAAVDIGAFESLGTTAANARVSGRILTTRGRAVSRAVVVITDASGEKRYAMTNSFGYYHFDTIAVGETYIFDVRHKSYVFSTQVLSVTSDEANFNFEAIASAGR